MKGCLIFILLAWLLVPKQSLSAESWYAPYHADADDFISLKQGCQMDMVRQVLGRSLRHLFTVRRNGSEWTLASVLINTGWNPAGLRYGVLFKDRVACKLVDYEEVANFERKPAKWHVIDGRRIPLYYKVCSWRPLDYTYVDRVIAAPSLDLQSFWEQVNARRRKDGFSLCGNIPLTLLIAPLAIIEYPKTIAYRNIHSSADMDLSGFRFAIGNTVKECLNLEKYELSSKRVDDVWILKFSLNRGRGLLRPYESARFLLFIVRDGVIEAIFNEDSYSNGFISPSWIEGLRRSVLSEI